MYNDDGSISEKKTPYSGEIIGFVDESRLVDGMTETFSFPKSNEMVFWWNFENNTQPVAGFYVLSSCADSPSEFCTIDIYFRYIASNGNSVGSSVTKTISADLYFLAFQYPSIATNCSENELIVDWFYDAESSCTSNMICPECLDFIDVHQDSRDQSLWHFDFQNLSDIAETDNCQCMSMEGKVTSNDINHFILYYPSFEDGSKMGTLEATIGQHINLILRKWAYKNGSLFDISCAPRYWVNKYIWLNVSMYDTVEIEIEFESDWLDKDDFYFSSNNNITTPLQDFKYGFEDYFVSLFDGLIQWFELEYNNDTILVETKEDNVWKIDIIINDISSTSVGKTIEEYFDDDNNQEVFKSNLTYLLWSSFVSNNDNVTTDTTDDYTISSFDVDVDLYRLSSSPSDYGGEDCSFAGAINTTSAVEEDEPVSFIEANPWFLPAVISSCSICLVCVAVVAIYFRCKTPQSWQKTEIDSRQGSVSGVSGSGVSGASGLSGLSTAPVTAPSADEGTVRSSTMRDGLKTNKSRAVLPNIGEQHEGGNEGYQSNHAGGVNMNMNVNMNVNPGVPPPSQIHGYSRESRLIHPRQLSNADKQRPINQSTLVAGGGPGPRSNVGQPQMGAIPSGMVVQGGMQTGMQTGMQGGMVQGAPLQMPMAAFTNNSSVTNNIEDQIDNLGTTNGINALSSGPSSANKLEAEMKQISKDRKAIEFNFAQDLKLVKCIGIGSFGKVYKATWEDNAVAVKLFTNANGSGLDKKGMQTTSISLGTRGGAASNGSLANNMNDDDGLTVNTIDDETEKELFAEIVLASQIPYHPNIVKIIGFCRQPLCVVMDYMRGGSVRRLVYGELSSYRKAPGLTEKLTILVKAASGLEHLHKQHVIHRDIAARNILLGHFGIEGITQETAVKVSDFGMARKMDLEDDPQTRQQQQQQTITQVGPLKWMSPESIKDHMYSPKTDVYMWGITMWEIMYGQEPYPDTDALNAAMKVVMQGDRPPFLWPLPEELEDLMTKCWDKSPEKRPDFETIRRTLKGIQDTEKNDARELKAQESESESN